MKRIILKIVPFALLFIVLNVLFANYNSFYTQQNEYTERVDKTLKNKPEVIFLGDSHTESIKLLDLSDNVGNLAYGADGIKEMYAKILIMLESNPNLKHIFITVEPQMFNNSVSPNSSFLNRYLVNVEDSLNVYEKSKLNFVSERIPLFNDDFLSYFLGQVYGKFKPKAPKSDKVWMDLTLEEQAEKGATMGKLDHRGIMTRKRDLEIFKEIVAICKARNIELIGTHFPVNESYINQADPNDINKVYQFLEEQNLDKILDYTHRFKDQKYFVDQDHLNKEGMMILSKYIYEDTGINILK